MSEKERLVREVRRIARQEALRAAPPVERWRVAKLKPFTLESFDSDLRLVEGEEDFDLARNVKAHSRVGDVVVIATDGHGDRAAVASALPASGGDPTGKSGGWSEDDDEEVQADRSSTKGCVVHEGNAKAQRPSGYPSIEWIGDAEPANALDADTWLAPGGPKLRVMVKKTWKTLI